MVINAIKPFVYGLYMWILHFTSPISLKHGYLWKYLSDDYFCFFHPVLFIDSRITITPNKQHRIIREIQAKINDFFDNELP